MIGIVLIKISVVKYSIFLQNKSVGGCGELTNKLYILKRMITQFKRAYVWKRRNFWRKGPEDNSDLSFDAAIYVLLLYDPYRGRSIMT